MEKLYDPTTSLLVEFFYFLYVLLDQFLYHISADINSFYNFIALFKFNIICNWKKIFNWFIQPL